MFTKKQGDYGNVTAHKMVANLCVEMAQEVYEELASSHDGFFKINNDRDDFVRQCAPTLRQEAVKTLAEMLSRNDVSEKQKEEIYQALLMDKALPRNAVGVVKK